MGQIQREQSRNLETHVNTRQDRKTVLVAGGNWEWDASAGEVSWASDALLLRGGLAFDTIPAGSISGINTTGDMLVAIVNRASGGNTLTAGSQVLVYSLSAPEQDADNVILLAARGADGRLYFANGSVYDSDDPKPFGTLKGQTDRTETAASGSATYLTGFDYTLGANQLAVYVGGLLQIATRDYNETAASPGEVEFLSGSIPADSERITFVNILGGQGPAGSSNVSLQSAWANGHTIDVNSGDPVKLISANSGDTVLEVLQGLVSKLSINADGRVASAMGYLIYKGSRFLSLLADGAGDNLYLASFGAPGPQPAVQLDPTGCIEFGDFDVDADIWLGEGKLRWTVYTGTLLSSAPTIIPTGLSDVLGVVLSVGTSVGHRVLWESATGAVADYGLAITFNPGSGDIRIGGSVAATGNPGTAVDGEVYRLVVFHQGV